MTKPQNISLNGLRIASCELAEDILGATNKNVLAAAWLRRRQYDRVTDLYRDLRADSTDADALNNLGVALRVRSRTDESVAVLQRAVNLRTCYHRLDDPFARFSLLLQGRCFPEGHYNLANALDDKGWYHAAIYHYRKAIQLKPNCVVAHGNLGRSFRRNQQYDKAIAEYHIAIAAGDASAMRSLGFM